MQIKAVDGSDAIMLVNRVPYKPVSWNKEINQYCTIKDISKNTIITFLNYTDSGLKGAIFIGGHAFWSNDYGIHGKKVRNLWNISRRNLGILQKEVYFFFFLLYNLLLINLYSYIYI